MDSNENSSSFFSIPEKAIGVFEAIHGLNITIHDIEGRISPHVNPDRSVHHRSGLCLAAKKSNASQKCLNFDVERTREEILRYPEGRLQLCHAGLVEFVWPGLECGQLLWVLFAGQIPIDSFDSGETLHKDVQELTGVTLLNEEFRNHSHAVESSRVPIIRESLGQLSARLLLWHRNLLEGGMGGYSEADQKERIYRFLNLRFQDDVNLEDLASELGLSFHRTSHLVNELFGKSFPPLLTEFRMRYAKHQLQVSNKSILEILLDCGFRDSSYFSWLFRREFGISPREYRKRMSY